MVDSQEDVVAPATEEQKVNQEQATANALLDSIQKKGENSVSAYDR